MVGHGEPRKPCKCKGEPAGDQDGDGGDDVDDVDGGDGDDDGDKQAKQEGSSQRGRKSQYGVRVRLPLSSFYLHLLLSLFVFVIVFVIVFVVVFVIVFAFELLMFFSLYLLF